MSFLDFGGFDFGGDTIPPPSPPPVPPAPPQIGNIGPGGGQGSGIGSGLGLGGLGPQGGGQGGSSALDKIRQTPVIPPPQIPPPGQSGGQPGEQQNAGPIPRGGGAASLSAMTPQQQISFGRQAQQSPSLQQRLQAKYQDVVRQLETSGGRSASQHLGGASNQFQFTSGARAQFQPQGSDWNDPNTQLTTLNNETAHNRLLFQNSLGRDPSDSELWLAHMQGFRGANQMLKFPDQSPVQLGLNPDHIASNVPGGVNGRAYANAPSRNFTSMWAQQYDRTAQQVTQAGGGTDQPVTMRSAAHDIAGDASDIAVPPPPGGGGVSGGGEAGPGSGPENVQQFLTGIKSAEGVPYGGFSRTGAIGAYGLTGDFIKQWAPSAGLPTDRASYVGNAELQDALASHAAEQMHAQFGDWRSVANAWLTGSPTAATSAPGNMRPAAYDARVLSAMGSPGGATPQGVASRGNTFGGAAPEGAPLPGVHAREQAQKAEALAPYQEAYEKAVQAPVPPPTPVPDIQGYVENWRQQHNQALINGQMPTFKGLWLGILGLGAGMVNGAFGHSTQAVGGFGNFAEGLHRGNRRQAYDGLADMKEGVNAMIKQYDLADRQRSEILENRNLDIESKLDLLKLEAAKNGDKQMAAALDRKDLAAADKLQFDRQKTILDLQEKSKKADELIAKWSFDENYKEKQAQQKHVDQAQKEADSSMKDLMKASSEMAKAIMQGGDQKAKDQLQKNIDMASKRRNEALARLASAQRAQSGQPEPEAPAQNPEGEEGESGTPFKRTPFNREPGDMVKDKSGALWMYKGSGDRSDKANYEQIE